MIFFHPSLVSNQPFYHHRNIFGTSEKSLMWPTKEHLLGPTLHHVTNIMRVWFSVSLLTNYCHKTISASPNFISVNRTYKLHILLINRQTWKRWKVDGLHHNVNKATIKYFWRSYYCIELFSINSVNSCLMLWYWSANIK